MTKEEIIKEIEEEISPIIYDYSKISHLFSDDEGKASFAKLNRALQKIKFLLSMDNVKDCILSDKPFFKKPLFGGEIGSLVSVRPCAKEYNNKTYLGFLIGEAPTSVSMSVQSDKITIEFEGGNPCIFIPETGTTVMGYESWWGTIESEKDIREITDEEIENVWYVKMWKQMLDNKTKNNE